MSEDSSESDTLRSDEEPVSSAKKDQSPRLPKMVKLNNEFYEFEVPEWTPDMAEEYGNMIGLDRPAELTDIRQHTREKMFPRPKSPNYIRPQVTDVGLPASLDYVIAIDDSGSSEPFFNKRGELLPFKDGVPTLGVLGMQTSELKIFNDDWIDYREFLREHLNLQKAPPIHAMLMHGPNIKKHINKRVANPYYGVPINKRRGYLLLADFVLFEHIYGDKAAFSLAFGQKRSSSLDQFLSDMHSTGLLADFKYLKTIPNKRWLKLTSQRMSSPLTSAVLNAIDFIDLALERLGKKKAGLIFDSFDETAGITQDFVDEILSSTLIYKNIACVKILDNSAEYPLLQAADFLAHTLRRDHEQHEQLIAPDPYPPMIRPIGYPTIDRALDEFKKRPASMDLRRKVGFQYSMFYKQLAKLDIRLQQLLVPPEDFLRRIDLHLKIGTRVTMFKDYDLSAPFV